MNGNHRKQDAFTLVELLVVVAIIALLAGLLLPSLGTARQKATAMTCSSNVRQMMLAATMYMDDNNGGLSGLSGIFPTWSAPGPNPAWVQLIHPYLKKTQVFEDKGRPVWMPDLPVDYYMNLLPAYVAAGGGSGIFTLSNKKISAPHAFILFSDDLWISGLPEIDPTNEIEDKTGFSGASTANAPAFHLKHANFAFFDGHAAPFNRFDASQMTYWYHTNANWQATLP